MSEACDLTQKKCRACEGGVEPMTEEQIREMLKSVEGWEYRDGAIEKTFEFKNFYRTIAFVNAVAWIANREDHHPDLQVSYKKCTARFSTHSIGGMSENDFICAAKVNALVM
ncbi:4a-hydroxytetrahydrobiopterin dehydratase [Kiritimatiella glycovorans]|uniref:Putative pterin-4-alpha-carbinolamine dehydratase n=1 Tax=Kiritimatiella glycovorans TaxID=1307763 RepID=A0A0G3EKP4_9BACT|nr:4a-hydroxytetrahydrobiopterin dehydratase [Kiritimatiella glycovorans]AKJ64749.1 Putative pterin-4-alpha-carbinolamine dehydratase [Kiritimatiella glycovorans]